MRIERCYLTTVPARERLCLRTIEALKVETDWDRWHRVLTVQCDATGEISALRQRENARAALERAVADGPELFLLLEDDLEFNRQFFANIEAWTPVRAHLQGVPLLATLCNFGFAPMLRLTFPDRFCTDPFTTHGSQCILLSHGLAEYLLRHWGDRDEVHSDLQIYRLAAGVTPLFVHRPSLVQHVGWASLCDSPMHQAVDFDAEWKAEDQRSGVSSQGSAGTGGTERGAEE